MDVLIVLVNFDFKFFFFQCLQKVQVVLLHFCEVLPKSVTFKSLFVENHDNKGILETNKIFHVFFRCILVWIFFKR